mgnify:CR=1 FL=1
MHKPGRAHTYNQFDGLVAVVNETVSLGDIMALTSFTGKRHFAALATTQAGRLHVAAHGAHPGGKVMLVPWLILEGAPEWCERPGDKVYLGEAGKLSPKGKRVVGRVLEGPAILLDPNTP